MRNEALIYMLLQIIDTECHFMIKNLSCNFGCMLLERSLIKSVILLAYILHCLKKYTSIGFAYFVVLGGMIFKSTYFPPKASSSNCSSLSPDQEPQSTRVVNLLTNVNSKLTEKGLLEFFRLPPTHTCIYEDI